MTWLPRSEEDLVQALDAGDVAESNRLDMKASIGDSDRARKETAKDLASFAVDGGALLIGVREDKDNQVFVPAPIDLRAAVERIEQIAANRVDPPLVVHPREIASKEEGVGYLWVDIPASPDAPHMVEGRYYGRGERTNRILTDADVLRLHQQREQDQDRAIRSLDRLQNADPFPGSRLSTLLTERPTPSFGHLYLTATPRRAPRGIGERLVWDRGDELLQFVLDIENVGMPLLRSWGPHFLGGIHRASRADHASVSTLGGSATQLEQDEQYGLEVRVGTDGSVGVIVTGLSSSPERGAIVMDGFLLANTWRLLLLTKRVAEEVDYTGTWDVGLRATELDGRTARSHSDQSRWGLDEAPTFDQYEYERTTSVTGDSLASPGHAVRALTEPLLRGLGAWARWASSVPELLASTTD